MRHLGSVLACVLSGAVCLLMKIGQDWVMDETIITSDVDCLIGLTILAAFLSFVARLCGVSLLNEHHPR